MKVNENYIHLRGTEDTEEFLFLPGRLCPDKRIVEIFGS